LREGSLSFEESFDQRLCFAISELVMLSTKSLLLVRNFYIKNLYFFVENAEAFSKKVCFSEDFF
jgi:hypothetical protein